MFRPSIQRINVLVGLAMLSLILYYIASSSIVTIVDQNYDLKVDSAKFMKNAVEFLKNEKGREYPLINRDPFDTRLIFYNEGSPILTDIGKFESKATVLKPNFSALIIDQLNRADVEEGDTIAVAMTGSMPGANIALLTALKTMGINYVNISSIGASSWGAVNPEFSWIHMEILLEEEGYIKHSSDMYSYGGGADYFKRGDDERESFGGNINREKIDEMLKNIFKDEWSELLILHGFSDEDLEEDNIGRILKKSINKRLDIYQDKISSNDLSNYKAYVNIGGGVASLGYKGKNKLKNNPGYCTADKIKNLLPSFDVRPSVMIRFAELDVPIINIIEIEKLISDVDIGYFNEVIDRNELDSNKDGLIDIGEGNLYYTKRFNLIILVCCLLIALGITTYTGFISYRQIKERMQSYDPD